MSTPENDVPESGPSTETPPTPNPTPGASPQTAPTPAPEGGGRFDAFKKKAKEYGGMVGDQLKKNFGKSSEDAEKNKSEKDKNNIPYMEMVNQLEDFVSGFNKGLTNLLGNTIKAGISAAASKKESNEPPTAQETPEANTPTATPVEDNAKPQQQTELELEGLNEEATAPPPKLPPRSAQGLKQLPNSQSNPQETMSATPTEKFSTGTEVKQPEVPTPNQDHNLNGPSLMSKNS